MTDDTNNSRDIKERPVLQGGCQCGAVRYRARPERYDPETGRGKGVICHCRMCQRAVGSPFLAAFGVPMSDMVWIADIPASFESSSLSIRHFCARCGTSLSYQVKGADRISLTIASLDDPEAVVPVKSVGVDSKLSWLDHLNTLESATTEVSMGALIDGLVNHQSQIAPTPAQGDTKTEIKLS